MIVTRLGQKRNSSYQNLVERSCNLDLDSTDDPEGPRGIWKAIGYQELKPCFDLEAGSSDFRRLEAEGIVKMKENTRAYAAAQLAWTRMDLMPALRESEVEFKVLPALRQPFRESCTQLESKM